ncbi:NDR1/HIN1-like protein 1 [Iris pallida]|uniref:NDR1/HIN1-like protein 1 n=1 Tax=Iris pallida TaxID=29817 RepID=A0AAX6DFF1_IRIPA|nr:NDR1/HIN1-like protein 1 [Iris pallida]KAJ6839815.1 NDR1/HIN1-like protein 1 [Iris pallida]
MAKDCGKHGNDHLFRSAIACIVFLVIVVLLIILIVFLVLHPHKPKFYLQDATVLSFNLSSPNLLSTYLQMRLVAILFQVTVSSKNPNNRVGVYYDRLDHAAVPDRAALPGPQRRRRVVALPARGRGADRPVPRGRPQPGRVRRVLLPVDQDRREAAVEGGLVEVRPLPPLRQLPGLPLLRPQQELKPFHKVSADRHV